MHQYYIMIKLQRANDYFPTIKLTYFPTLQHNFHETTIENRCTNQQHFNFSNRTHTQICTHPSRITKTTYQHELSKTKKITRSPEITRILPDPHFGARKSLPGQEGAKTTRRDGDFEIFATFATFYFNCGALGCPLRAAAPSAHP